MAQTNLQHEIDQFYENYQGAEDNRTDEERAKDFNQEEFVATSAPVNWQPKTREDFRAFPELNQFYTGKCVAFTTAKLALINFWLRTKEILHFSPNSIYNYRVNKPSSGMVGNDAFDIWKDRGISLEAVAKSDQVTEEKPIELSLFAQEVAKGFILGNYITINNGDFDKVASTIQVTGKGVMTWFYFTNQEWSDEIPTIKDNLSGPSDSRSLRHSVTAVDYGILDGQEVIKIEDSAHFGGRSVRYITRDFFNARNFLIKYPMNFNYEQEPTKPTYNFTRNLEYGMTNDPDVVALQDILKHEQLFPSNTDSTGNYFSITARAVGQFQAKYGISPPSANNVGPLTRQKLNQLYS